MINNKLDNENLEVYDKIAFDIDINFEDEYIFVGNLKNLPLKPETHSKEEVIDDE